MYGGIVSKYTFDTIPKKMSNETQVLGDSAIFCSVQEVLSLCSAIFFNFLKKLFTPVSYLWI
jgi:hypothetical protein